MLRSSEIFAFIEMTINLCEKEMSYIHKVTASIIDNDMVLCEQTSLDLKQ